MDLVQRLHWFADTKDTAIFWGGCEGHFPIDDMRLAADEIERLRAALKTIQDHGGVDTGNPSSINLSAAGQLQCRIIACAALVDQR